MPEENRDISDFNFIIVHDDEVPFFDAFTKKYHLRWDLNDKINRVLPLSRALVGYITTPRRTISLKPKYRELNIDHILRLYLYVYGYRPSDSAAILDVSREDADSDIGDIFLSNLEQNVHEGLYRTYGKVTVKNEYVKGRPNFAHSYVRIQERKRKPIVTRTSILTMDNAINNLLYTALLKLIGVRRFSSKAKRLSFYFEGSRSDVSDGSRALNDIVLNTNTVRFRRTLMYAAMIIDHLSYSDTGSSTGADSFVINFDRLFESFVVKCLKEYSEKKLFATWDSPKVFAETADGSSFGDTRSYLPDLLYDFIAEDPEHDYEPTAKAVLDVKNKAYNVFKNQDVYQLLTYRKLLQSQKMLLLYPSFIKRLPETLRLDDSLFEVPSITACFVNIADNNGDAFLHSLEWFADSVQRVILGAPIRSRRDPSSP